MNNNQKILAEAIRVEVSDKDDKVYITFEVKDQEFKKKVKAEWYKDIEYILLDKLLMENES